jgi:uncharacterized protein (TIGR00290 family)
MFPSANLDGVPVIASVAGIHPIELETQGNKEKALTDMEADLAVPDIEGVIAGAVASDYQAERVKAITDRLGLHLYTPLWHEDKELLIRDVASRMDARIVFTAAEGLDARFPGARSDENRIERLKKVAACHRINPAGGGGDYESITLHALVYTSLITFETSEIRSLTDRHELVPGGFA